jgi:KipI family sensor histidine kinase inhibitor
VRVRAVGASAALVDVAPGSGARWRRALLDLVAAGTLPAPDEIVPGHSTVLVDGLSAETLARALAGVSLQQDADAAPGPLVEIPAVYDGADLADVARLWGTDVATVVERHAATDFRVEFCGFAPGFAYLSGLTENVPRHATPRTRVPAGAVALAGLFCGIYPSASPGGWQVIGRTGVGLFDADNDPPALLPPGTRVRFVPVDDQPTPAPLPRVAEARGGRDCLTVVRAGALSTVQDGGRRGAAHLGVPRAGPLDGPAARLANRLVGNDEEAAVLETTLDGVGFRLDAAIDRSAAFAVTGAPAPVHVDGRPVEWGVAVGLRAGSVVEVGRTISGVRSYVAVSGGLLVTPVLGSRSTDTLSGLGPPVLAAGQLIGIGDIAHPPAPVSFTVPRPVGELTLRVRIGPHDDWFAAGSLEVLTGAAYTVSTDSNRVGARLRGPAIARRGNDETGSADEMDSVDEMDGATEMDSVGMVLGAVQVPPDGQPVVFLADHPTTGGYPVIGVVEPADLAALAQARPGTTVRLRRIGA